MGHPALEIDLEVIRRNAAAVKALCGQAGVAVAGVVKGAEAMLPVAEAFLKGGIECLADSRMDHLEKLRRGGVRAPLMLLRVPMLSETEDLVRLADYSLQSERAVLEAVEKACRRQGRRHGVVLMADLGDLREGWFEADELLEAALYVERNLERVRLAGIGANLGCYGSVAPTAENLGRLVRIAESIEARIGRRLEIVSGGSTSSLKLLAEGTLPRGINHLRIGEAILTARDLGTYFDCPIKGLAQEGFTLKAEVVEVKKKPSHPVGTLMVDAFGEKPVFEDRGIRMRAIAAVGRKDFGQADKLIPLRAGVQILGASSDHLILDVEDCPEDLTVGDVLSFGMFYGPMLFLCASDSVEKRFKG